MLKICLPSLPLGMLISISGNVASMISFVRRGNIDAVDGVGLVGA